MLKETGYQEKIEMVAPWLEEIIEVVKKDLKNEHLKADKQFCKKYLLGRNPSHVTIKELAEAYQADIRSGNVGLAEFIATRWLLKHTDIYGYFEGKMRAQTADFEALEELPHPFATALMQEAISRFGPKKTYLFSVFNSVVFSSSLYADLKKQAERETEVTCRQEEVKRRDESLEAMQQRHSREMAALTDRYEKKLSGLQRKYLQDTEALKRQIALLQKRVSAC